MLEKNENDLAPQPATSEVGDEISNTSPTAPIPTAISSIQRHFIDLDKRFNTEIKPFLDAFKAAKAAVAIEVGIDGHFQDEEGTVYQAVVPTGRFVAFDRYAVNRTRREGETKGDLSMTAARELGYVVEGK